MINLSKFAETLDNLIFEHNNKEKLDGKTLASHLGVAAPTITRYLTAKRAPTINNLVLLADYFNCTTDFLLGRENENYAKNFKSCPQFSEQFKKLLTHYGYNCLTFAKATNIHQSRFTTGKTARKFLILTALLKLPNFLIAPLIMFWAEKIDIKKAFREIPKGFNFLF